MFTYQFTLFGAFAPQSGQLSGSDRVAMRRSIYANARAIKATAVEYTLLKIESK
jgi:hypothetical protein